MRTRAVAACLTVLALAGCGPGEKRIPAARLPSLVLQLGDLPPVFDRFDEGKLARTDAHPGPREDPTRFGHKGGWKARYKRSGSAATPGPLVVESRADLFGSEGGAKKDLDAYRLEFEETVQASGGAAKLVRAPEVGSASHALTLLQAVGKPGVRSFAIAWRERNVTASVLVQGFDGRISLAEVVALARKQNRRIVRATAG